MKGKILGYDLTGFRQHLSSEGGKSQLQKKKLCHISDNLRETGRRKFCEQCIQTWLAYQTMLALTLFRGNTFAKQLPLTILVATALLGTSALSCAAQVYRVLLSIVPRVCEEPLQASSVLAAFGWVSAKWISLLSAELVRPLKSLWPLNEVFKRAS